MNSIKSGIYGFVSYIALGILWLSASNVMAQNLARVKVDSLAKLLNRHPTDIARINIDFQLAQFHIWKPETFKADMDSAEYYINDAIKLNGKLRSVDYDGRIQLIRAYKHSELQQPKKAEEILNNAITDFIRSKNYNRLGEAYYLKSAFYDATHRGIWVERALAQSKKAKNAKQQADCLMLLADLNNGLDTQKTIGLLDSAAKYYQAVNYKDVTQLNVLYARIYLDKGFYTQGLKSLIMALKSAEAMNDRAQLCQIYYMISSAYSELNDYAMAAAYARRALSLAVENKSYRNIYQVLLGLTDAYVLSGHADSALVVQKNVQKDYPVLKEPFYKASDGIMKLQALTSLRKYGEAEIYFKRLSLLVTDTSYHGSLLKYVNQEMTRYCLASGQYQKAAELLKQYEKLRIRFKFATYEVDNYQLRITLDTARRDYKAATKDLFRLILIKDSTYNVAKTRQFEELQFGYQNEKRSNEIKLSKQKITMLTQDQKLQQASLQKANLIRNVVVVTIFLLVIAGVFFFRQYKARQYASKLIERKNAQLEHLLSEKEWLLKEVHHRVKNNLHTVMCLLESQAEYLESDALAAIEKSKHRIYAMSLIHQKLYQTADVKTIDMDVYLPEFINYLEDSFRSTDRIIFSLVVDPIRLDVSQAVPIALIINEAVTNAIKYAFPNDRIGEITVTLLHDGEFIKLTIADNGTGIAPEFINGSFGSLGLKLIYGLSNEIRATINIKNDAGTIIEIVFAVKADPVGSDIIREISERGVLFES